MASNSPPFEDTGAHGDSSATEEEPSDAKGSPSLATSTQHLLQLLAQQPVADSSVPFSDSGPGDDAMATSESSDFQPHGILANELHNMPDIPSLEVGQSIGTGGVPGPVSTSTMATFTNLMGDEGNNVQPATFDVGTSWGSMQQPQQQLLSRTNAGIFQPNNQFAVAAQMQQLQQFSPSEMQFANMNSSIIAQQSALMQQAYLLQASALQQQLQLGQVVPGVPGWGMLGANFQAVGTATIPTVAAGAMAMQQIDTTLPVIQSNTQEVLTSKKPAKKSSRKRRSSSSGRPKRPPSAYNLFYRDERKKIMKELEAQSSGEVAAENEVDEDKKPSPSTKKVDPNVVDYGNTSEELKRLRRRKPHGIIGLEQLTKLVAERWKELDQDRRDEYEKIANEAKEKHRELLVAFMEQQRASTVAVLERHKAKKSGTKGKGAYRALNKEGEDGADKKHPN